eukprot:3065888-Amphidinium_carterae.1
MGFLGDVVRDPKIVHALGWMGGDCLLSPHDRPLVQGGVCFASAFKPLQPLSALRCMLGVGYGKNL